MTVHKIPVRKREGVPGHRRPCWFTLILSAVLVQLAAWPCASAPADASRGQEILAKFLEVNRYWLMGPPPAVHNYSYVLQRGGEEQNFNVRDAKKAPRSRLQGITYEAMIHQLARMPESAKVRSLTEEEGRVRLDLTLDPDVKGACGNGVENSWIGYHSLGGSEGFVVLDPKRWVPLEAGIGRLRETFGEFVPVDEAHYVPLAIRVKIGGDTEYNWRFWVYEPGLWLFDESYSAGRRLAWIEKVRVNSTTAKVEHATIASLERANSEAAGQARLQEFLEANRHWLLPSVEVRRGVVYEYRQEAPYLEKVLIDPEGNLFVRLEATRDSPDQPTRQRLWLADGRSYTGNFGDGFVKLEPKPADGGNPKKGWPWDRVAQHLAMGLALDCALTRVAREPDAFWAETRPLPETPGKYLLVLHAKKDARLFTGTMLAFSSWSFMHDVKYEPQRNRLRCRHPPPARGERHQRHIGLERALLFRELADRSDGCRPRTPSRSHPLREKRTG